LYLSVAASSSKLHLFLQPLHAPLQTLNLK
jgi:hypothetical protein